MNTERTFIYRDAKGNITARTIDDISETETYLQGFCLRSGGLRTFRKDRILENLPSIALAEDRLRHHLSTNPPPKPQPRPQCSIEICFTGFKHTEKERLVKTAEDAGFLVRSCVTSKLSFLCGGSNAGPVKIEKARKQGAIFISEDEFIQLIQTGEIPDV